MVPYQLLFKVWRDTVVYLQGADCKRKCQNNLRHLLRMETNCQKIAQLLFLKQRRGILYIHLKEQTELRLVVFCLKCGSSGNTAEIHKNFNLELGQCISWSSNVRELYWGKRYLFVCSLVHKNHDQLMKSPRSIHTKRRTAKRPTAQTILCMLRHSNDLEHVQSIQQSSCN